MAKEVAKKDLSKSMSEELRAYSDFLAAYGSSIWERYVLMALLDSEVQKHFIAHVENDELFLGAKCWTGVGLPEETIIIFEFTCIPPRICFVSPTFLVRLNIINYEVLEIKDPYIGPYLRTS